MRLDGASSPGNRYEDMALDGERGPRDDGGVELTGFDFTSLHVL